MGMSNPNIEPALYSWETEETEVNAGADERTCSVDRITGDPLSRCKGEIDRERPEQRTWDWETGEDPSLHSRSPLLCPAYPSHPPRSSRHPLRTVFISNSKSSRSVDTNFTALVGLDQSESPCMQIEGQPVARVPALGPSCPLRPKSVGGPTRR